MGWDVLTSCARCIYYERMTTVNVRVEAKTKKAASKVLKSIGLDLSAGVKIFLTQVAIDKGLPFRPTKNPAAIRAKWDREVEEALRTGKRYKSGRELLDDILK